ncbi:NAD-dependent epimerase/dehydratase family protein [Salinarimonas soli]|uniref:UDP-glucose 4-epimerase n=1 Tax=Salinarimonas soli TaxID=1638099 RepID=A0A5B2VAL9_9HYPH|nr:NAD-dependent epimerase/dehydratase family protein [Salinarimonas soli]KAA2235247.1 NAD-dependent epimerase/dehydratase family protein [Salinarimonas soli]
MLIVGAAGFVGRHLCAALSAAGRESTCVSRKVPDAEFLARHAPHARPLALDEFEQDVARHLRRHHALVYLASSSVPGTFAAEPWRELSANVDPLLRLAHAAVAANPAIKLVYVSSGGTVYGRGDGTPFLETAALAPISSYGYGKVAAEEALRFLGRSTGLRTAILRAANPIGRWQSGKAHGIVSVALRAALSGSTITLFGGGLQVRDFFDADDLVAAIITAADGTRNEGVWNVGSGVGTRVIDVVGTVERVTGRPVALDMHPARSADVSYAVLDCARARADLGWSATIPLEESIARMAASA